MKHPPGVMEDERCGGSYSFPPPGVREEERCGSRENQTSHSCFTPASSRASK
jgi:hypothetical protein